MEVYFVDVAQGSCQVILLGGQRAIVIDCGILNGSILLQFLKRFNIAFIEVLIVTHSHNDHAGGALSVLDDYKSNIGIIGFVQDDMFLTSKFFLRLKQFCEEGHLLAHNLYRLERNKVAKPLWKDGASSAELKIFSPTTGGNILSQAANEQNETSAVISFEAEGKKIVFASDSCIPQWRQIRELQGEPLLCDILTVPHHAGEIHKNETELDWLYSEAVIPDVAIISVGTSNQHGHPREDVVRALIDNGIHVMCTQITRKCNVGKTDKEKRLLEHLRPGVVAAQEHIGKSKAKRQLSPHGNSLNVACAGTIVALIKNNALEISKKDEHFNSINKLSASGQLSPLCRH